MPFTDPYFRGFDPAFPDYYRYTEWERDFDTNYSKGGLPNLTLVRFMHDHTGSFATAIDGVNTPDRDVADNDYAVGLLVEKIANSIYANNTLIFVVEDDAQDGGDHIDSHRTTAYVAGAYVKNGVVHRLQHAGLPAHDGRGSGPATDEPERRAGHAHDRHLQYNTEHMDLYSHSCGDSYCYEVAASRSRAAMQQSDAERAYWARVTKEWIHRCGSLDADTSIAFSGRG